ncbi:arsinothricin resistance N-acetyltransferase ArsN1 family B [Rheinheimera sp.]|uniref:arsinothricin resistance N-acetyltransferase ArsN1 family B n=1 Tax=Rheinheimera sp. TaxID=1869214 RepID=UPI00307EE826
MITQSTELRNAAARDAAAIAAIYNHYVLNTSVTFEEEQVNEAQMTERIAEVQQAGFPWLVLLEQGEVLGYAYASPWRLRSAYRFSAESTVYLKADLSGRGYGSQLYMALLARLKELGFRTVMGGITLPNRQSVQLHEKCGFAKVAHFSQVGYKFGQWLDVGYWQKLL